MGLRDVSVFPDPDSGITQAQYDRLQAWIRAERAARLRAKDNEYRKALGLPLHGELPKSLGNTSGAPAGKKGALLRGTKRPA